MEYAKDEIFDIRYDEIKDKLQFRKNDFKGNILYKIRKHKFLSTIVFGLMFFSTINLIMIYNFMKILQNV